MSITLANSGITISIPTCCGEQLVQRSLESCEVPYSLCEFGQRTEGTCPTLGVVRDPFDWYIAVWEQGVTSGWEGPWLAYANDCFSEFIKSVARHLPAMLFSITERVPIEPKFLMKYESLLLGLPVQLHMIGEKFNEQALSKFRKNPEVAVVLPDGYTKPEYDTQTAALVVKSEWQLFEKYRYSFCSWEKKQLPSKQTTFTPANCICGDTVGSWKTGTTHRPDCPVHQEWRKNNKVDKGLVKVNK